MKVTTMARKARNKITCKLCGQVFMGNEEWIEFEDCQNSNCPCPRVKEAAVLTRETINKARVAAKTTILKKEHDMPLRANSKGTDDEVYIIVPTIQTFQVSPIKKRN